MQCVCLSASNLLPLLKILISDYFVIRDVFLGNIDDAYESF